MKHTAAKTTRPSWVRSSGNSAWQMLDGLCQDLAETGLSLDPDSGQTESPALRNALERLSSFVGASIASLYEGNALTGFYLVASFGDCEHLPKQIAGVSHTPLINASPKPDLLLEAQKTGQALFIRDAKKYRKQNGLAPNPNSHQLGRAAIVLPLKYSSDTSENKTPALLSLCKLSRALPGAGSNQHQALIHAAQMIANYCQTKYSMDKLQSRANVDGLTQLYNYSSFYELLGREVFRSHRYGSELSLLLIDIDFFKKFNDQYGHLAGDQILRDLSIRLRNVLRASDLPARYGGDELTVILPETDLAGARKLAQRIRNAVASEPFYYLRSPLTVTLSIGAAQLSFGLAAVDLVSRADQQLYHAKAQGRDQVAPST